MTLTATAREQAHECEAWWRKNRDATELFSEELLSVIERLETMPTVGTFFRYVDGMPVRRTLMPRTATHVYYSVDSGAARVLILAVWGARKGHGPRL